MTWDTQYFPDSEDNPNGLVKQSTTLRVDFVMWKTHLGSRLNCLLISEVAITVRSHTNF